MASTVITLSLVAIVIYIFWVILNPQEIIYPKTTAKKQISKKIHPELKGKNNKQQVSLPSTYKIRKEKTEQMKIDPKLIGRVVRYWLRER
jgi:hypothetical protein